MDRQSISAPILRVLYLLAVVGVSWSLGGCTAAPIRPGPDLQVLSRGVTTAQLPRHVGRPEPPAAPGLAAELETSHPQVRHFVNRYQTNMREFIDRSLSRGSKYLDRMTAILTEEGIPTEFAYIPIVESGFRVDARSHAGAVGPWQFIRSTGRSYGLRIDGYVDERQDPEKSTRAAARYLRDLHDRFGDWHLSLAAYNVGEGRIERIRSRQNIDSYWEMTKRGHLPRETSEYVPRCLAAMEIARAPEMYGFEPRANQRSSHDEVYIDRFVELSTLAKLSGTRPATLNELNPALRQGVVPPKGYTVRVPTGSVPQFQAAMARLPRYVTHTVRRGETPVGIARRYGVSARLLMTSNNIRDARRLRVGQRLRIPAPVQQQVAARAPSAESAINQS